MTERGLPEELRCFIARHIVSVEKLEILILLSEQPSGGWTVETVFKAIQSNRASILRWLQQLSSEGFLEADQASQNFTYQPRSSELADGVELLKNTYRERPTRVIEAIFSQSTDQLRKFSDAFRFRKDPS